MPKEVQGGGRLALPCAISSQFLSQRAVSNSGAGTCPKVAVQTTSLRNGKFALPVAVRPGVASIGAGIDGMESRNLWDSGTMAAG